MPGPTEYRATFGFSAARGANAAAAFRTSSAVFRGFRRIESTGRRSRPGFRPTSSSRNAVQLRAPSPYPPVAQVHTCRPSVRAGG